MAAGDATILRIFHEENQAEKAFKLLVDTYAPKLYFVIRRIVVTHEDADDVLQNTFVKVWLALPEFRADSMLMTWLYRIATNEALQFKRKYAKQIPTEEITACESIIKADPYFSGDDAQLKLEAAILTLPEKQRAVFILKYFQDLTYEEISEIMDTSAGALKANYHHAVKKIEKYFEAD